MNRCYLCQETIQGSEKTIFDERFNHLDEVIDILGIDPVDNSKITLFICEVCKTKLDGLVQTKNTMETLAALNDQLAQTKREHIQELKDRWIKTKHVTSKVMTSRNSSLSMISNCHEDLFEQESNKHANCKRGQHYACDFVPLSCDDEIDLEMSCSADVAESQHMVEDGGINDTEFIRHEEINQKGMNQNCQMLSNLQGNLPSIFPEIKMEVDDRSHFFIATAMDMHTLNHKSTSNVQTNERPATMTKSLEEHYLGETNTKDGMNLPSPSPSDICLNSIVKLPGDSNAKVIGFTSKGNKTLITVKRLGDHAIIVVNKEDLTVLSLAEQRDIKDLLQKNSVTSESKVFKKTTTRKTTCDIKTFHNYMVSVGEMRLMEDVPYPELCPLLVGFLMNMKKADGYDYEPATLRGFISSFDRYLKKHHYGYSICYSREFLAVREALREKKYFLTRDGRGNNPQKADPITDEDIEILWTSGQMGVYTAHSIIHTLWFYFTLYFGMNGTLDHYNLHWGDVCLEVTPNNVEYLVCRMRKDKENSQAPENKENKDTKIKGVEIFANLLNPARCVVNVYKKYASVRPQGLYSKDAPFYLTPLLKTKPGEPWYCGFNCGHNNISTFMKKMVEGAGIRVKGRRLSNSSVRKLNVKRRIDWK